MGLSGKEGASKQEERDSQFEAWALRKWHEPPFERPWPFTKKLGHIQEKPGLLTEKLGLSLRGRKKGDPRMLHERAPPLPERPSAFPKRPRLSLRGSLYFLWEASNYQGETRASHGEAGTSYRSA